MFKNMKMAQRLISAFVGVVLLASIAGVLGIALLKKTNENYSSALVTYGFAQGDIGNLGRHFQNQRATVLYVLTAADPAKRSTYLGEMRVLDTTIDEDLAKVGQRLTTPAEQEAFATISSGMQEFRKVRDEMIKTNETLKGDQMITLYRNQVAASSGQVSGTIDTILSEKTRLGDEKSAALFDQSNNFSLVMIGAILGAMAVALVLATMAAKGISRPVIQMEYAAKEIAKGNYDVDILYEAGNEIGGLADGMRSMIAATKMIIQDADRSLSEISNGNFDVKPQVEYIGIYSQIETSILSIVKKLSDTLSQIRDASDQVSSGSDQVSSGAQALSQGATEQASAVQELSATINEISSQVKTNATNAVQASQLVVTVSDKIQDSNQQMESMISAMAEISNASREIGKVIKTIEDIAFQTNILALNAAVEAARAGAAGKGFAVVADEVRNLASKSAEAAKGTTSLIEGSIKAVENGTKIADQTAKSLLEVVEGAQSADAIVSQIANASNEQANAIYQVTSGIDQISAVVQTNSATAEESAAASEELSGQAQMLKQLVSRFHLNEERISAPPKLEFYQEQETYQEPTGSKY